MTRLDRRPRLRRWRSPGAFVSALVALCALAQASEAQEGSRAPRDTVGTITGRILDPGNGGGVSAAEVLLSRPARMTSTVPNGAFAFHGVPAGEHQLIVEHLGYGTDTTAVVVRAGETTTVELRLSPRPYLLEPLSVTVRRDYLESVGFYDRREKGIGRYFTPEKLERLGIGNLGRFRPEILLSTFAFAGTNVQELRDCDGFAYFLDGRYHRWGLVEERVRNLSASEVGAVEVYPHGHGLPTFALRQESVECGAVVIWTERW